MLYDAGGSGFAHDEAKRKVVTITGMVVDTGCYMSHDAVGKVHMPVAADHKNQNR